MPFRVAQSGRHPSPSPSSLVKADEIARMVVDRLSVADVDRPLLRGQVQVRLDRRLLVPLSQLVAMLEVEGSVPAAERPDEESEVPRWDRS
jgi:hypothetical protein